MPLYCLYTVIADGLWPLLAPDHVEYSTLGFVCFGFFFLICCCNFSVNQTVIGRISPFLSGPVCFAVADVAENRQDEEVNSSPQGVSNASLSVSPSASPKHHILEPFFVSNYCFWLTLGASMISKWSCDFVTE